MQMKMQIDSKIFSHEKIGRMASCNPGETYVIFSMETANACSTEITGGFRQRFLTEKHFYKMAEMASGWHIASFLQAITGCCSNFVGKIGRAKVTMMVVSLLTLTEIVFETKTLVDGIKRKNVLPDNDSLTDLDDQQCSFGGYDDSLRGYVILYALSNVAEILYFTVWFYVFYHKHSTPIFMHLLQNLIAIALEMPLMCMSWCMLQGLPGKVNYDDVFWDMILLDTFLVNAWLSMCFKLWDILSTIQDQDEGRSVVVSFFLRPSRIMIMSCFHTIFLFTPIVYTTGNFQVIVNDNDTQRIMEIIRVPGKDLSVISCLFSIPLQFYTILYGGSLCYVISLTIKWAVYHIRRCWTQST